MYSSISEQSRRIHTEVDMSSYEFWDELGKIFNAVVAYQEKNLEFNKRFISPWIRLGNVFEKQDRNKEAINAYETGDRDRRRQSAELVRARQHPFQDGELRRGDRALSTGPSNWIRDFGLAYSNLALTLATMGETEQAVALYQKGHRTAAGCQGQGRRLEPAGQRLSEAEPVRTGAGGVPQGGRARPRELPVSGTAWMR